MKRFIESNGSIFVNTRIIANGNFGSLPCVKQGGSAYVGLGELLSTALCDEICNSSCFKTSKTICAGGYTVECSAEVVEVSSRTILTISRLFNRIFITDFHVESYGDHLLLKITYVSNK